MQQVIASNTDTVISEEIYYFIIVSFLTIKIKLTQMALMTDKIAFASENQ